MFSIGGIEIQSPEKGNSLEDTTVVLVQETESDDIHTHILPGQFVRKYTADIPEDVLLSLLALVDDPVEVIFDSPPFTLTFNATMTIEPLTNDKEFVWTCDFTFYED